MAEGEEDFSSLPFADRFTHKVRSFTDDPHPQVYILIF